LATGRAQSPTAQHNCQNGPHDRPRYPAFFRSPRKWGRNRAPLGHSELKEEGGRTAGVRLMPPTELVAG
jgi:hypothetical protein